MRQGPAGERPRRGELGSFRGMGKWFHLFRVPANWVRFAILPAGL